MLLSTLRRLLSILLPIGRLLVGDFNMTKDVAEAATQNASYRPHGTIFALDAGCPLVAQDARSVTLQSFDIGAQSLHHLHGLDVVNRIDSDGQLRYVKRAVISGSGNLSSISISEVLRSNTIKRATCFGRV